MNKFLILSPSFMRKLCSDYIRCFINTSTFKGFYVYLGNLFNKFKFYSRNLFILDLQLLIMCLLAIYLLYSTLIIYCYYSSYINNY